MALYTTYSLVVITAILTTVNGYGQYREEIPNGENVPHPCKANYIWKGVGHRIVDGGKTRNLFGLDFHAAGKKWTKELCEKDSDSDGKTNGEELGDPECVWTKGNLPSKTTGLSHPGVCEPWQDDKCKDQLSWLKPICEFENFTCDGINNEDVKQQIIQFPPTTVPAKETSYICKEFYLDKTGDFHLIATEPIINNSNVMHHAVLFGCDPSSNHTLRDQPHECGMVASRECRNIISIWTLGSPGDCIYHKIGFRIGQEGYKRVALQFHWNNPQLVTNYKDSSGMILYYTANKREFDAGILTIGADYINIPPLSTKVQQTSICPGQCSKTFMKDKVYAVTAFNHMHYLGRAQTVTIFRDGEQVHELTNDPEFNYDSPVVHHQATPKEILPGDTFSTTCTYSSKNKNKTTNWGDATSDEMCYGFITYFPNKNLQYDFCTAWKSLPQCLISLSNTDSSVYNGCNLIKFRRMVDDDKFNFTNILTYCNDTCTTECKSHFDVLLQHPCMANSDFRDYAYYVWSYSDAGKATIKLLEKCYGSLDNVTPPTSDDPNGSVTPPTSDDPNGSVNVKMETWLISLSVISMFSIIYLF